ncbi:unnamed protein product [Agarophyton chilense]
MPRRFDSSSRTFVALRFAFPIAGSSKMLNPTLVQSPCSALPLLLSGIHVLAAGGFGKQSKSDPADSSQKQLKKLKTMRNRLISCSTCSGSGVKPCQFCQGTKLMVGFLGKRVPCVPCKQKGTLGRPCKDCSGMGFLQF